MNIFISLKRSFWVLSFVTSSWVAYAQNITVTANNGQSASNPLVQGTVNKVIHAFKLQKANATANSVTGVKITLTDDPTDYFTNIKIIRSLDAILDGSDAEITTATISVNNSPDNDITITDGTPLTTFSGGATPNERWFFIVADVLPTAPTGTAKIQASLLAANVTDTDAVGTVSGTATGLNFDVAALTITLSEVSTGIPTTLGSEDDNQPLLGFSLNSNGTSNFTDLTLTTTQPATGRLSNIHLYRSSNNTYDGSDTDLGVASSITATTITFTGLSSALAEGTTIYFFLVADVDNSVDDDTDPIKLTFDEGDITISGGGTVTATTIEEEYDFADETAPTATGRVPADNSTGISVLTTTAQLTLSEDVKLVSGYGSDDNHRIRLRTIGPDNTVETVSAGNISISGNVVTITFITTPLTAGQQYAIYIGPNVFEDLSSAGNDFAGYMNNAGWVFTAEVAPNISSLANTTRCIGDQLVINGTRFMGTGGTPGVNKPEVRINGTLVPDANVTAFTATSITLTVPPAVSTGNVVVKNMDNNVSSNGITLTVNPQILTGLTVTPSTTSPAQNTSVNVVVGGSQNSYRYDLILTSRPAGYSVAPGTSVDDENGNGGNITLNTSEGTDPDLTHIGSYGYRVDVSRTGCTTRTLTATISLTVASLAVTVSSTNTSVCNGSSSILIGSTSGGTGFYQFSWKGPNGFTNTSSSPTITPSHPSGTGWYVLTLSDNSSNKAKDSVFITTYPVPTASIVANPGETDVRVNYIVENRDYLVTGSPAGGEFTGQGIVKKSDGNFYFNPLNAGLGIWPIVYTYTDINGCQDTDSRDFLVQALAVDGVALLYCQSQATDSDIRVNLANAIRPGYQFTRARFYAGGGYYDLPMAAGTTGLPSTSGMPPGATYPLRVTSLRAPITQTPFPTVILPDYYTLNLNDVRNGWGYGYYYIDVFGKDIVGNEVLQSWAYFRVVENGPVPAILGINEGQNICATSSSIELTSSEPGYDITNFTMSPAAHAGSLTGVDNKDFNPGFASLAGASERLLTVTMAYKDFNGCPNTVDRSFNWIRKPQVPTADDVEYCKVKQAQSFTINASPVGSSDNPNWYGQDPVAHPNRTINPKLDSVNFQGFVAPGIDGLVATAKDFYVTTTYKGCEGSAKTVEIKIKEAPTAAFIAPPICEDRNFTISGPLEAPSTPYDTYIWNFGNGVIDTVSNNNQTTYNYGPNTASLPPFKIKLTVINSEECSNESETSISVGNNPVPIFSFEEVCENTITKFHASTNIPVANYTWNFNDPPSPIVGPQASPNASHQFVTAGDYNVQVTATTGQGCFGIYTKTISILKYLTHTTNNPYEMSLHEGGKGFWKLQDFKDSTTWEFGVANKTNIQSTSPAWVTNVTGNYKANDMSVLNSPCLNISGIDNPVLSLDFISNTDRDKDGASLEISLDDGITWNPLGNAVTGQNWFNSIFSSGDISEGWSGNLWDPGHQWLEAKHGLDMIPSNQRNKVRFRVAFSSNLDRDRFEGFAFANVAILPRNRFILVENFTNESSPVYAANNTAFKAINPSQFVKLQYNLSFPGPDPIHAENPVEPNARAGFYGITNDNQTFPRVFVDGNSKGNLTTNWFNLTTALRALKSSPLSIEITTSSSPSPNQLTVSLKATALREIDLPFATKPVLHLAIVEKTIGNNEFVVRKMLPSVLGTVIPLPLHKDDFFTVGPLTWDCTFDPSKLVIVAFIQDEVTKEVYQASINASPNPAHLPSVITGLESDFAEQLIIYPNPAEGEVNIQLPEKARHGMRVSLIDGFGREVYNGEFNMGEQSKKIYTSSYSDGMYILQIKSTNGKVARKKVMIANK